ncbi:hypothetical protein QJS04_geneDACA021902 [Acorus gramineus]|uniref:Uncharacterized protein n=1 Tax=Acorus gramineus TaxID=55184 RepID=A0AAV9BBX3_ACOGR|nr:hypothetical protein QJS04_geneDACA021902 [Acorus gramineus]
MGIVISVRTGWNGSKDGTVQIWEVETGRCLRVWEVDEAVQHVSWNPLPDPPILVVCVGRDLLLFNMGLGNAEEQSRMRELLNVEESPLVDDSGLNTSIVRWSQHDKHEGIRLKHIKSVSKVEWHCKEDYFTTVMPGGSTKVVQQPVPPARNECTSSWVWILALFILPKDLREISPKGWRIVNCGAHRGSVAN